MIGYSDPIWEITGTFGAFWLVNSYFAYPALLIPFARIFGTLLIVFLIFFVARNSSIAFGESITKRKWLDKKILVQNLCSFYVICWGLGVDLFVSPH